VVIALAHEPPFALGRLRLLPPTREIIVADGTRTVVEPRVMQVLIALARADGAIVTRVALTASCWDGRIVGEDAINRVISRLRQAGVETGGVFRVETVTRIGYRLIIDGAPVDNCGVAAASPAPAPSPLPVPASAVPPARWRVQWFAATFIAVVFLGIAWWSARAPVPPAVPHLDVRPFTALSPDITLATVAAAREEIVAAFGVTSLVDVTTTPRPAPGPQAWALTGSIGRSGADLRVVVHLTHVTTGTIVWSMAIDRPAADVPRALKQVGANVAEIVVSSLPDAANYRGGNLPDAALALVIQFNQDTTLPVGPYHHATEELRRVVAQVPDFAEGWSMLALSLGYAATASDNPAAAAAARAEGPAVIARALHYHPGDALALMAAAKLVPADDFIARDAAFRDATAAPTSRFAAEHSAYSVFLANVGRAREAISEAKFTYDLDPIAALYATRYAQALAVGGQVTVADTVLARTEYLWPDFAPTLSLRARLALWSGDPSSGAAAARDDPSLSPAVRAAMLGAFAALAMPAQRAAAVAKLAALGREPASNSAFIVSALGALGADGASLDAADRLITAHGALAAEVLFDPTLASARRMPPFAALVERVGLAAYWRQSGHHPDFCIGAVPPAACAGLKLANSSL